MTTSSNFRIPSLLVGAALLAACAPTIQPAVPAPVAPPAVAPLPHAIIPLPGQIELTSGEPFLLDSTTSISVPVGNAEVARIGEQLAAILRPPTAFAIPVGTTPGRIELRLGGGAELGEEGYRLQSSAQSVIITAQRPAGLFHGVQTLRQLFPPQIEAELSAGFGRRPASVPAVDITDSPRFAWRGAMLDPARHFLSVQEVKSYIDGMALYKLNRLHLHLGDDQGWRIEIKSHPRLTELGASTQVGGGAGGFYTQEDYSEIVRYAAERYITVVPEIDMPGHTNALLVAYPELSCSTRAPALYTGTAVGFSAVCPENEQTYRVLEDVLRELAALTPGEYLHVGGDEVEALSHERYALFITRVQGIVSSLGKRMVGWEEIAQGTMQPGTVSQLWNARIVEPAVRQGMNFILSPASRAYIDMKYNRDTELGLSWAGLVDVKTAYDWDPATFVPGVGEASVLGVEAPLWGESVSNLGAIQYLAFPRLPALAEVAWTPQGARDWDSFRHRVAAHAPRWRLLGINYHRAEDIPW